MVKKYWAYKGGLTECSKDSEWLKEEGNIKVVKLSKLKKEIDLLEFNIKDYIEMSTEGSYKLQTLSFLHKKFGEFKKQLGD